MSVMKGSIRRQLMAMMCFLLLAVIVLMELVSSSLLAADYEVRIKRNNAMMAESLGMNISQFLYSANNINQMLAEYPGLAKMPSAGQKELLANTVEKYPWFQLLAITDLKGDQAARSSGREGNRADRPWFKRFMATKQYYISNTYYSVTTESPITTIVHGMYDNDTLVGIMMADIEIDQLQQMVERYNLGEGSYAYLLDGNGAVVAHPDRRQAAALYNYKTRTKKVIEKDLKGYIRKDERNNAVTREEPIAVSDSLRLIVGKVMNGEIGSGEYTELDGREYLCAYRPIELPGTSDKWSLIVVREKDAAMAFLHGILLKTGGVGLIMIFLAALLSAWYSRRLTEPIVNVVEATNRIKDGDLTTEVPDGPANEIGVLAKNFNQMVATLRENALEREKANKKISTMAFHDALTGLPNRLSLNRYLEKELKRSRSGRSRGVIFFIDIDDFKSVNDNFGHSFGDEFLRQASRNIAAAFGEKAFVARWGGDEFIAVVPGVSGRAKVREAAQALITRLAGEYRVAREQLHMSASIGAVLYPEDGDRQEDLLKRADSAMYAAKEAGRNCWRFYEPAFMQEGYEKMVLTNELRRGLEKNELSLEYQPQFAPDGRRIIGFEALARWNSPEYGAIPPEKFIPLAEQNGLILPIGKWVMQEACKFAKQMADCGREDIHIAINISPYQLAADDFVDSLRSCLADTGVKPCQIEIEITENLFISSMDVCAKKLCGLQDIGIMLSLDDFGIGYSSLTYLRRLPVEILKIDKSFIDTIVDDNIQFQVVGSIVELGHKLGMSVVAEGVETKEQLAVLQELGCDRIQGYIFSRPLPQEIALALLETQSGV